MRIFEKADPMAAFDRALGAKRRDYAEALALASRLFFLEAQRRGEIAERRALVARLHDRARAAARAGDEDEAVFLLDRKRRLVESIASAEAELVEARADAREARRHLLDLGDALEALARDRRRAAAGITCERIREASDRPLSPRLQAALDRAREQSDRVRGQVDADRALGSLSAPEDVSLDLELRALSR